MSAGIGQLAIPRSPITVGRERRILEALTQGAARETREVAIPAGLTLLQAMGTRTVTQAGVEFIAENGGRAGLRLRKAEVQ